MKRFIDQKHIKLISLLKECKMSKSMISRGINMNISTFINKVDGTQPHYKFSEGEFNSIYTVILNYVEPIALRLPEEVLQQSKIFKPISTSNFPFHSSDNY